MDKGIERARARAIESGHITDMQVIRDRVFRRDLPFSERVVLTALVKGDENTRGKILRELESEQFGLAFFDLVFEWITSSLRSKGTIYVPDLYHQMENFVRSQWDAERSGHSVEEVLPGFTAIIDHVLAIEPPDAETIDKAISLIHESYVWRKVHTKRGHST